MAGIPNGGHQATAVAFIQYLTSLPEEKQLLDDTGFPPVWTSLYSDPAMVRMFPYLPVVKQAILSAQPRPAIPDYDQVSLAISSAVEQALTLRQTPQQALSEMAASSRRSSRTASRHVGLYRRADRGYGDRCEAVSGGRRG